MTQIAPYAHLALTWVMFLALFPMAFFWLRRAWRIIVRRDFSEVALKRGVAPANPAKFAPYVAAANLIGGVVVLWVIAGILLGVFAYATWTALAGTTIWCKFFIDFALSRHAHALYGQHAKKTQVPANPRG